MSRSCNCAGGLYILTVQAVMGEFLLVAYLTRIALSVGLLA